MEVSGKKWKKGKRAQAFLVLFFASIFVFSGLFFNKVNAITTPPSITTYQGKLLYNGLSVTTTQSIAFILYDSLTSGTALYTAAGTLPATSTISVTPSNGLFSVDLGGSGTNSLSSSIFKDNAAVYLEVVVGGQALSPRKQITSAPYALNSEYLNGLATTSTPTTSAYIPATDANGNISFSGSPQSVDVGGGVMYINPTNATSNYTLFGVSDNGTQRFRIDKEGDTAVAGKFSVGATSTQPNEYDSTYKFYVNGTSVLGSNSQVYGNLSLVPAPVPAMDLPAERVGGTTLSATYNLYVTGNITARSAGYYLYGGGFGDGYKLKLDSDTSNGSTISSIMPISINSSSTLYLNNASSTPIVSGSGMFTVGGALFASSTLSIGTSTSEFKLTMDNDGGIIARGTYGSGSTLTTEGAGTRLIWYPQKAAFRAGIVDGAEWDDANIGGYSAAFGKNTTSSGYGTLAFGNENTASGLYSFSGGGGPGGGNLSTGSYSFSYGSGVVASGDYSTAFGSSYTNSNDYSLSVGNGSLESLINASGGSSWFNLTAGNVGIGTSTPSEKLTVSGDMRSTGTSTFQGGLIAEKNLTSMSPVTTTVYSQGALYLSLAGNYLYVADSSYGTKIIDITNPRIPVGLSTISSDSTTLGVYVSGNYLYSADFAAGLKIIDISSPKAPVLVKTVSLGGNWVENVFVSGNYAYVSGSTGLSIVNITDPANATTTGSYDPGSNCKGIWVSGKYAFLVAGLNLKVLDISSPNTPLLVKSFALSDTGLDITVNGRYAYIPSFGTLQILDISDPLNPSTVGNYNNDGLAQNVYISDNRAYLATQVGVYVLDITSPATPVLINLYSTDISDARAVLVDGGYLYVADVTNGVRIFDVSGAKISNTNIGNAKISNLNVLNQAHFDQGVVIKSGLTVGGSGIMLSGDLSFIASTSTENTAPTNTLSFSHTALFKSFTTDTESNLFVFDTANAFTTANSSTAFLLSVRNNGTSKFSVASNGDVAAAGNFYAASVYVGTPGNVGDLSERVDIAVDDAVEPGDVLMVDPMSADTYRRTAGKHEQSVAGVVSTNPVIIVGNGKTDYTAVLAMVGRVPVKVSDENGAIQRGDLLVSASQPGYAMKYDASKDDNKMVGIIGVALESLASGTGKIMSLIRTGWANSHTQSISTLRQNIQELASSQGISINTNPADLNVENQNGQLVYNGGNLDMQGNIILNIASIAGKNDRWSIDSNGHFITRVDTSNGKKEMFSMQSPVSEFVFSSSSQLIAGEIKISFDAITKEIIDFNQALKVSVTLTSGEAKGVYVSEKNSDGFTVKELGGGTSNASFDWMVVAKRKDGVVVLSEVIPEPQQPVTPPEVSGGTSTSTIENNSEPTTSTVSEMIVPAPQSEPEPVAPIVPVVEMLPALVEEIASIIQPEPEPELVPVSP